MNYAATLAGFLLLFLILGDTFETIVLPRTATRRLRLTRLFYISTWAVWAFCARLDQSKSRRDSYLGVYGPLSLLLLIVCWALGLIVSFALIHWGIGTQVIATNIPPGFITDLYMSGTTFFTLGFGDVTPSNTFGRMLAIGEAGLGFGFLGVVIGYLPVIYQSFSRREVGISQLDARAGSPPTAAELLRRHSAEGCMSELTGYLREWEKWASDLLESHLSYPVLVFYRSQHDRESWLAALTAILDTCALLHIGLAGKEEWIKPLSWQTRLTFAICRHAVVDLALIFRVDPLPLPTERLTVEMYESIRSTLKGAGLSLCEDPAAYEGLEEMRRQYEPYLNGLAQRLMLEIPPFLAEQVADNWQTSAWDAEGHFHH